MALENDDILKAPDKPVEKQQCSTASGVTKVGDEKPPKPMKEKTNLEELDEIELETLLKETITYKSPRDRDCRSSLFNKLLVSAEDSIRKDSALNASGSEAVRHRNPQASRRSRYHNHRTSGSGSGSSGVGGGAHQGGHGSGKRGGACPGGERREGAGCSGPDGGGSIAEKGTLGGSLNNLTVEDLYESISQHLQQRPEKSVSARQRTGGSLPCNVNAGLITPCETPLFITERKSQQTSCATLTSTNTTTVSTYTTSNWRSTNASAVSVSSTDVHTAPVCSSMSSATLSTNSSSYTTAGAAASSVASKDCCVIDVEQEDCCAAEQMASAEMIGIESTSTLQPTSPEPTNSTSTRSKPPRTDPDPSNSTTIFILTNDNKLLDNIPHIDDDDIVEEQQRQYQHKLNYTVKQATTNDDGTELQPLESSDSSSAGASSNSDVDYYYMGNKQKEDDKRRDDVERRPLLSLNDVNLNDLMRECGSWSAGRVAGSGPMKIVGQGQQIKTTNTQDYYRLVHDIPHEEPLLHKRLVTSSLQTRPSLEDPPFVITTSCATSSASTTPSTQHLTTSLSHHHSTQQPHHQHTGAVRISSLSSANMLNINHKTRQQRDGGDVEDADGGEMAIGVPSSLTGLVGIEGGDRGGRMAVGNFMSEATIHVGDVVDTAHTNRSIDQDNGPTPEYIKNYGILPTKKIDDNGNHVAKSRKKTKPPEVMIQASQIEGHIGAIASGDINKVMAFICGNGDSSFSNNVAKSKTVNKSNAAKMQQHRGSVSGTNNRTGGKSVDAEHHSHSRRHPNHHSHHNQQNHPPNQQDTDKKLHRANSLEEMPTTTLEEFHENESKDKQQSTHKNSAAKQITNNNQTQPQQNSKQTPSSDSNKKSDSVNSNNSVSVEQASVVVNSTNNRGRGMLRATKSNAEKSGGSRSGGSVNRGSVPRGGGGSGAGEGPAASLQPRRSWTNADPSPLQAIVTTASAENLETDFTLVNSKKKKGKKQQQRRNSVGSRTPLNTQPQTLTSPPSNSQQQQSQQRNNGYNNNNNNNNRHNNNSANSYSNSSNTAEYHANANNNVSNNTAGSSGAMVVNLASLVQASAGNTGASSHSDKSNGEYSSLDEDSVHSQPIDVGLSSQPPQTISSPPNLTSYASITKNNVATQQPIVIQTPPQPQNALQTSTVTPTPKWPTPTSTAPNQTSITASTSDVAIVNNTTENVVVSVQMMKVVTNRSQEQQTDDIPPTLLLDNGGGDAGGLATSQQQQQQGMVGVVNSGEGQKSREHQNVMPVTNDNETNRHQHPLSADPPSLGDMQRWPSINNNKPQDATPLPPPIDIESTSYAVTTSSTSTDSSAASWPSLGNPPSNKPDNMQPAKSDQTARVVVRTSSVPTSRAAPLLHQNVLNDDMHSVRHMGGGGKHLTAQQYHGGGGDGLIQNHVVLQPITVVHPVMVTHTQHPSHCMPQTVIPLIPITTLPPPNLIDHNTPPPPNFIPNQQQINNHIHHQSTAQYYQQYCTTTIQQLPVNIPDVQMIEHQLQLQHNNNNNHSVHSKNSYNQQYNENKGYKQQQQRSNSQPVLYQQSTVEFIQPQVQAQTKRPAVVIMRGNSSDLNKLNSPLGDLNDNQEDTCCELTFGFDVNEELLSLQVDEAVASADEQQHEQFAAVEMDFVADTTVLPDVRCGSSKDVCNMFASRFFIPECCIMDKEFNYEKIVDFVANAWNETVSDINTGKCNFYQDL